MAASRFSPLRQSPGVVYFVSTGATYAIGKKGVMGNSAVSEPAPRWWQD
jgi:hypothetical protein